MSPVPGGGPWPYVAGASVQGRQHLARGRENQDAFHTAVSPDGQALVLAISDGAGSRPRAALGSHLAVDVACRVLARSPAGRDHCAADWQAWLSAAAQSVITEYLRLAACAHDEGCGLDETTGASAQAATLAATLAAAVSCPPWMGFVSIGDCFGAVLTAGSPERCHLVLPPETDGELTVFLSSPSARSRIRSFVLWDPGLSGIMLATDGCAALALDHPAHRGLPPEAGPQPAAGFFASLAGAVRAAQGDAEPVHRLLTSEHAARCADDLTVLCAVSAAG